LTVVGPSIISGTTVCSEIELVTELTPRHYLAIRAMTRYELERYIRLLESHSSASPGYFESAIIETQYLLKYENVQIYPAFNTFSVSTSGESFIPLEIYGTYDHLRLISSRWGNFAIPHHPKQLGNNFYLNLPRDTLASNGKDFKPVPIIASLTPDDKNLFHFMYLCLPRILSLKAQGLIDNPLLFTYKPSGLQREILAYVGITNPVINLDVANYAYSFKEAFYATPITPAWGSSLFVNDLRYATKNKNVDF